MADHGIKQFAKNDRLAYGLGSTYATIDVAGVRGILQSVTVTNDGETKTYRDNTGITTALLRIEDWQTCQCEALLLDGSKNSIANAKKAEVVKLTGVNGLDSSFTFRIENISIAWSNEDVAKVSFSVRGYTF